MASVSDPERRRRIYLRVLVYAFRKGLQCHVPVCVNRHACEDGRHDSSGSARNAKAHDDVDGDSRALEGEDAPILHQDRELGAEQGEVVGDDAEEEVLRTSVTGPHLHACTYLEDEVRVLRRHVEQVLSIAVSCSLD